MIDDDMNVLLHHVAKDRKGRTSKSMKTLSIDNIRKAAKGDGGFTLIELLVTVTVIGILAAVVSVGVGGASTTAQTKANVGTFNQVQAAVDAYTASGNALSTIQGAAATGTGWYDKNGATILPGGADLTVTISTLTSGVWLRLYNNTGLTCFFEGSTSNVKGCK